MEFNFLLSYSPIFLKRFVLHPFRYWGLQWDYFHYLCVMDFLNDGYKVKTLNSLQCTGYQIGSILIVLYLRHNDTRGVGTL